MSKTIFKLELTKDDDDQYSLKTEENIGDFEDLTACKFKLKEIEEEFDDLWKEQVENFFKEDEE